MSHNVLLVDEQAVVRAGVRMLLEHEGLTVVAEASCLADVMRLAPAVEVHVVVADVMLKDVSGAEAVTRLRRSIPTAGVLVLTTVEDPAAVIDALRAGARGYVSKHSGPGDLVDAVRRVASGQTYVQPSLGAALLSQGVVPPDLAPAPPQRPVERLTPREIEVLRLLARGHTNAEMGVMLGMSLRTVEAHRARLLRKLAFGTRAELVRYAAELGLLEYDRH